MSVKKKQEKHFYESWRYIGNKPVYGSRCKCGKKMYNKIHMFRNPNLNIAEKGLMPGRIREISEDRA